MRLRRQSLFAFGGDATGAYAMGGRAPRLSTVQLTGEQAQRALTNGKGDVGKEDANDGTSDETSEL